MSYTLKLTNGQILLTLADQQTDNVTTSLTLIGKNVNAYGTYLNDNFIKLLENFSNTVSPTSPLTGQLWFDTNSHQLNVYNGTAFASLATQDYANNAASLVQSLQFVTSIDVTGYASGTEDPALNTFVINYLELMVPPTDSSPYGVIDNTRARVLVTRYNTLATTATSNAIGFVSTSVYQAGTSTPVDVVKYQTNYVSITTIPSNSFVVNRAIKQYKVSGGSWVSYVYTGTSNTVYTDGTW